MNLILYLIGFILSYLTVKDIQKIINEKYPAQRNWTDVSLCTAIALSSWISFVFLWVCIILFFIYGIGKSLFSKKPPKFL